MAGVMAAALGAPLAALSKAAGARFTPWKGGTTPPLILKDRRGRTHDLAAYRGRVVLFDGFGTVAKDCKARRLPVSFLVGPDGRIRHTLLGAANWTAAEIVSQIERLMPAKDTRRG